MVHALQLAHAILRPRGLLINVHELPAPHLVEVHAAGTVNKVGWLLSKEDADSSRAAFSALLQIVDAGYFIVEDERDFGYSIYADSLAELQAWLAKSWSSAPLTDSVIERLEELTRDVSQPATIVLALRARMTKLRSTRVE